MSRGTLLHCSSFSGQSFLWWVLPRKVWNVTLVADYLKFSMLEWATQLPETAGHVSFLNMKYFFAWNQLPYIILVIPKTISDLRTFFSMPQTVQKRQDMKLIVTSAMLVAITTYKQQFASVTTLCRHICKQRHSPCYVKATFSPKLLHFVWSSN